jgi:hypothetical protein
MRGHAFAGDDLTLSARRIRGGGIALRRRARVRRIGLLSMVLAHTGVAADPVPSTDVVRLSIPDCDTTSGARITELVGLELASHPMIVRDDAQRATIRASLRCSASHAVITVEDSRRTTPLVLHLELEDTRAEARPRLLALAVAELIATSRLERTPAVARVPVVSPVRHREPTSSLWIAAGVLRAHEPAVWSPALTAGAAHDIGPIELAGDLELDWGGRTTAEATVGARSLSLSVVPTLPLMAGRFGWGLGLGLRAGYVWLEATPREQTLIGQKLSGVFVAPILQSAHYLRLSGPWFARLALEAGYVAKTVRGLDADGNALLEVRGLRVGALLGLGLSL